MQRCISVLVFVVVVNLLLAVTQISCVPPRSFKGVKHPREGRPMNDQICLVYSQKYQIELGGLEKLHPFDINKYGRIYLKLQTDGLIVPGDVFVPESVTREDLQRVHTDRYLDTLKEPAWLARYLEMGPLVAVPGELTDLVVLQAFRYGTGGTILASELALEHGMAINLAGGYHHAGPESGEGFCIYADMAIAIRKLQAEGKIRKALIVDLDAHQGNGSALCFEGDDSVFTFDMHEEGIYPQPKETNDLDIGFDPYVGDQEYLKTLKKHLPKVFRQSRPDVIFYQAGVDVLSGDPLSHFELTPDGILQRDEIVFAEAARRDIPIVMVLGGGYSDLAWWVQYRSIANLLKKYGLAPSPTAHPRKATVKEKVYVK